MLHYEELPEIEQDYITMLMSFRDGKDWSNYEKFCLGVCRLVKPVVCRLDVLVTVKKPKKKIKNHFGEFEVESSDEEKYLGSKKEDTTVTKVRKLVKNRFETASELISALDDDDDDI